MDDFLPIGMEPVRIKSEPQTKSTLKPICRGGFLVGRTEEGTGRFEQREPGPDYRRLMDLWVRPASGLRNGRSSTRASRRSLVM